LLAHPEASKGTVTFPIVFCWYKGQPALYIQTDASDPGLAAQQRVNLVPRLANAIQAPNGGAVDDIYHVTNFKQGNVIPSAPIPAGPKNSDPNYTPIWQVSLVTWNTGTTPRVLTSEEDILGARDDGEVTLCVIRSCETSLARGPSYGLSLSSTLGFWFQRPRL
jgi:hypothetical protein